MMNSIRPDALASLLLKGEAETGNRPVKRERQFRDLSLESTVSSKIGMHGAIGDRMVGSWSDMKQGSRIGKGTAFMVCRRPEELYPGGDRASDYGEILRRFGDRVVHIHLKDVRRDVLDWARKNDVTFNSAVREGLFTVPGGGNVDFAEIGKFVRSSRCSGWAVVEAEQDPAKAPPRIYTEKAYQYVKNLLF
jgi:hypothetical protein